MSRATNRTGAPDRGDNAASVSVRDFAGLVTNSDPHDMPPGAAVVMVNATPVIPGQLTVRRGAAVVRFDPPPPAAIVVETGTDLQSEDGNNLDSEDGTNLLAE